MQLGIKVRRDFWWTVLTMVVPDCIINNPQLRMRESYE